MEAALDTTAVPLGLVDKTRLVLAVAAAVALLWTIGWMVAEPVDPHLSLTFMRSGRPVAAEWPALAVLTVVAGIMGTAISGRRLPEAGLFAAAIGVASLSLRGGSMETLLVAEGANTEATRRAFLKAMTLDCALWAAIMVAAWFAVTWAWRWVWASSSQPAPAVQSARATTAASVKAKTAADSTSHAHGLALGITAIVALLVVWLTAGRTPVANVARGQTIAAVAGGLYLGAMAGRYFTGVDDSRWYLLAVPVVGLVAYVVGYWSADMSWAQGTGYQYYAYLATTPVHDLVRPLPVEYIAVGVAATIAGFWGGEKMEQVAIQESA